MFCTAIMNNKKEIKMKHFISVCIFLSVFGCTKEQEKPNPVKDIGCTISKVMGSQLAAHVAVKLECKNVAAINETIEQALVKVGVCDKVTVKSFVDANPVCSSIGGFLLSNLVGSAIPASWECNPARTSEEMTKVIEAACQKLKN